MFAGKPIRGGKLQRAIHRLIHIEAALPRLVWSVCLVVTLATIVVAEEPQSRIGVPSAEEQERAKKLLGEIYGKDYRRAETVQERVDLARRIRDEGLATKDDHVAKFAALQLAGEIAADAGDLELAIECADAQAKHFDCDGSQRLDELVKRALRAPRPDDQLNSIIDQLELLVDRSVAGNDYTRADQWIEHAIAAARKAKDGARVRKLVSRRSDVATRSREYDAALEALRTLKSDPTNPAANLSAGRFYCFINGDWSKGLPMLALCDDESLSNAARFELQAPTEISEMAQLGDDWWLQAERESGRIAKSNIQQHAAEWYRRALPSLTGIPKSKVETRLASLEQESSGDPDPDPSPGREKLSRIISQGTWSIRWKKDGVFSGMRFKEDGTFSARSTKFGMVSGTWQTENDLINARASKGSVYLFKHVKDQLLCKRYYGGKLADAGIAVRERQSGDDR